MNFKILLLLSFIGLAISSPVRDSEDSPLKTFLNILLSRPNDSTEVDFLEKLVTDEPAEDTVRVDTSNNDDKTEVKNYHQWKIFDDFSSEIEFPSNSHLLDTKSDESVRVGRDTGFRFDLSEAAELLAEQVDDWDLKESAEDNFPENTNVDVENVEDIDFFDTSKWDALRTQWLSIGWKIPDSDTDVQNKEDISEYDEKSNESNSYEDVFPTFNAKPTNDDDWFEDFLKKDDETLSHIKDFWNNHKNLFETEKIKDANKKTNYLNGGHSFGDSIGQSAENHFNWYYEIENAPKGITEIFDTVVVPFRAKKD